jgi:hypothetical protein
MDFCMKRTDVPVDFRNIRADSARRHLKLFCQFLTGDQGMVVLHDMQQFPLP